VEIRWFFRGTLPLEILAWFDAGVDQPAQPAERVDHYLHLGQLDSLGIKLREGNVEIKLRQCKLGTVQFHQQVAGQVEHWRKWSFALAVAPLQDLLVPTSAWLPVHKSRRLRRYQVAADEALSLISPDVYPDRGCDLEVTQVRVHSQAWWTVGFEAFGPEARLRKNLCRAVEQVLKNPPPLALTVDDSFAYPRWLQIVGSPLSGRFC
jgi:hypothetical protein